MRITRVMRGRERPAIAQQLRITEAALYAELGPGAWALPFPISYPLAASGCSSFSAAVPERMERRQRSQQPGAGAAVVPGVMERGQRRGPLSECVPGLHGGRAAGDDRAETPGPLLRGGCAWAGVPGLPAWQGRPPSGSLPVSEPQRALLRPLCCRLPPRGAAIAGAPCRWGSRWRFAAPFGERRAGFAARLHVGKGCSPIPEGAAERRRGMVRRLALRTATRPAQGQRVTRCYPVEQMLLPSPTA